MDDVARRAGVSRALVSLVMRGQPNVSARRRAAVLEAAEEIGYRPNRLASQLASRRTGSIGVIINDLHNPYFAEVVDGLGRAATEHGLTLFFNTGWGEHEAERRSIDAVLEMRPEGIVLLGPLLDDTEIRSAAAEVPIAVVGRHVAADNVDTIATDEVTGAALAVDHLADLGHRRIAHLHGGPGAGAAARLAGYEKAMAERGLTQYVRVVAGDFTEASGVAGAEALLHDGAPTAIFAANDLMAVGAMSAVDRAGLDVPGDVSIVGYDNTSLAAMQHMSLSTIDQPRRQLGRVAIDFLVERLAGRTEARHEIAPPTLVVRSTSARVETDS